MPFGTRDLLENAIDLSAADIRDWDAARADIFTVHGAECFDCPHPCTGVARAVSREVYDDVVSSIDFGVVNETDERLDYVRTGRNGGIFESSVFCGTKKAADAFFWHGEVVNEVVFHRQGIRHATT